MTKSTLGFLSLRSPRLHDRGLGLGLDIVEFLITARDPKTPSEINAYVNIPVATLYRLIRILEMRGYIAKVGNGYSPTSKLHDLYITAPSTQRLLGYAQSLMQTLSGTVSQACTLSVPTHGNMVVVAWSPSPGPFGINIPVGFRYDLMESGPGLAYLAFSRNSDRSRWNDRQSGVPSTNLDRLNDSVRQIAGQGYSRLENPCLPGITDLSCPVYDGNHVVAVLTVPYLRTLESASQAITLDTLLRTADQLNGLMNGKAMVA